ncbi:MAG: preprotein translocase subunit SecA [Clostridia bacterium]
MMGLIKWLSTYDNKKSIKKLQKIADKVNLLKEHYEKMSDNELKSQTNILKERLVKGETLDNILPDAFAVVSEASFRVLHMRHFNVQILGGIVLHEGRIAEMRTGEGKTLVSTLPAYLNALSGEPVFIVTVNEYLAKRDAEWMGKIHKFLGLTVGVIYSGQMPEDKRKAYACDITYGTNSEFGFDYLRDNMVTRKSDLMARGMAFAIIDEVDSILIDEARTPLIISGPAGESSDEYKIANSFAKSLKAEDYSIDEKQKTIHLTQTGNEKAEKFYRIENLSDSENLGIIHNINNAIRAHYLMKRDNEYIVRNDEVLIVDEFTGRVMVGRRYADGLHQAVEAKENVKINNEDKTYATITLQNYFKIFKKLSGMTGTAKTEEGEFRDIYGLDVVVIPTNKENKRIDANDVFYLSHQQKVRAIIDDVVDCHNRQQPVLVGTITVEKSEELAKELRKRKIPHNVLNAKNNMREAEIVASAGKKGTVTIATNMAGRGTDIMLGGNAEFMAKQALVKKGFNDDIVEIAISYANTDNEEILEARTIYHELLKKFEDEVQKEKDEVIALGGLHIIGTERHESRRIDNQLRGRAGRQGDPGSSVFYISGDDDLARIFGGDRLKKMASTFNMDEDTSINWKFFSRSVETAQKRVEGRNYSIRRQVVEFDNVLNKQREEIFRERNKILSGESMHDKILDMITDTVNNIVREYMSFISDDDGLNITEFNNALESQLLEKDTNFITEEIANKMTPTEIADRLSKMAISRYEHKIQDIESISEIKWDVVERDFLLQVIDRKWIDHIDDMETLRQGIGLRAYGNKNPITIYQTEGFDMFDDMIVSIRETVAKILTSARYQANAPEKKARPKPVIPMQGKGTIEKTAMVGRNSPCPCGSGKKYKNCCGKQ